MAIRSGAEYHNSADRKGRDPLMQISPSDADATTLQHVSNDPSITVDELLGDCRELRCPVQESCYSLRP